ncbi:hypothetical protein H4219_004485 [Mycoemilia scoparia]|uniref:Uncharacterized protein n=1 Tax=Mycoemilia scoparia TaxID=417184 RepID=A0A9W7ZSF3_9FUNG|nr:hypothetical protein H4219_004485 [Mycoemilia scoparia]
MSAQANTTTTPPSSETLQDMVKRILHQNSETISKLDISRPTTVATTDQAIQISKCNGITAVGRDLITKFNQTTPSFTEDQKETFFFNIFDETRHYLTNFKEIIKKVALIHKTRYNSYGRQLGNRSQEFDLLLPSDPLFVLDNFVQYFRYTDLLVKEYSDGRDVITNATEFSKFVCGVVVKTRLYASILFIHDAALAKFVGGGVETAKELLDGVYTGNPLIRVSNEAAHEFLQRHGISASSNSGSS